MKELSLGAGWKDSYFTGVNPVTETPDQGIERHRQSLGVVMVHTFLIPSATESRKAWAA